MANMSIREFIEKFEAGLYEDADRRVQIEAGWYDWFCNSESLRNKTRFLGKRVVQLSKSPFIDIDTMYVFFKNNCPVNGKLYDSFSICDLATGDVIYWITPANGHKGSDFNKPQVSSYAAKPEAAINGTFNNWREVREAFKV